MPDASSGLLFDMVALPEGFQHADDFLGVDEEAALLERFRSLDFHEVRMRGVAARRRVIQYGWKYSFESLRMTQGPELPDYLRSIRDRAADFAGLAREDLSEALVTEYSPGAAIGWHRDAPGFGVVVGISLASNCRFRFRRGQTRNWTTTEVPLKPRSIYVLKGAARSEWQHSIPAVGELRYSITFRTMRERNDARRKPRRRLAGSVDPLDDRRGEA
jgi:alkylated DNA repair protein (DNA oxidative demethylase)